MVEVKKQGREVEPLLTVSELATVLKVKSSWVYRQVRLGEIPTIRLGKYRRFCLSAVLEHFDK